MNTRSYVIWTIAYALLFASGLWLRQTPKAEPMSFSGTGYGGPIHMKMDLSSTGTITSLKVTQQEETSSYIHHLDTFLGQFIGRTPESPLVLRQDIDAISGATITSQGITTAVREERALRLKNNLTQRPSPSLAPGHILILSLLTILAIASFCYRHNTLRWIVLLASMIYLGIINHTMLSIIQVAQVVLGRFPTFAQNPFWWMIMGISFISALFLGRIYCGAICPFAVIQELLFRPKPNRFSRPYNITPVIDQSSRLIKYILLFSITGSVLYLNTTDIANIEPFITLFAGHGTKLAWALVALTLVLAVFHFRFWCKYLCPVGALTGLAASLSLFKIKPTPSCTSCGACANTCPVQAITPDQQGVPRIDMAECITCAKCLRECPVNALKIQGPAHDKT